MSSKIKKIISGLMCMALLAVYAVPVNATQYKDMGAETASACKHTHTNSLDIVLEYISLGSSAHDKLVNQKIICFDCNKTISDLNYIVTENHSWTYRDLGHVELSHNYEVVCIYCHHTERTSVPCDNENGPHNTPNI